MNKKQINYLSNITISLVVGVLAIIFSMSVFFTQFKLVNYELILGVLGSGIGAAIAYTLVRLKVAINAPKIFISYSHKDSDFVKKIYNELKETPYTVFMDKYEIQVGDNIKDKINEMMVSSDYIIFVESKNSIDSDWAKSEIEKAKALKKKILPLKIDKSEPPSFLKNTMHADFSKSFDSGMDMLIKALKSKRTIKDSESESITKA